MQHIGFLKVKCPLTIPSCLLFIIRGACRCFSEKGPNQMSLFSFNNFCTKAMVNNKYNCQDNHQSYSSRPDAVSNVLKLSAWV